MNHQPEMQARRSFLLKAGASAVSLSALALVPSVAQASAKVPNSGGGLPTGAWAINANGTHGTLQISDYDNAGNISATMTFDGQNSDQIIGFFDAASQKVFFNCIIDSTNPQNPQLYTGYIIRESSVVTLAGFFETFVAGTAARYIYGWYAVFQG